MRRMKLQGWKLLFLLVPFVVLSACDDDDDDNDIDVMTSVEFIEQAAASDTFEIMTGTMAAQKGTLDEVKNFGQELVRDHTLTSRMLKAMARQKGIAVPTAIPQDKAAIRDRLASETGTAFDKDFANVQVQAHQEAIQLYERASEQLQEEDLRTFAEQTLPVLRMHLQHAQELKAMTDQL